jgi:hypothetical protein
MKIKSYKSPVIEEILLFSEGMLCHSNDATIDMTPEEGVL